MTDPNYSTFVAVASALLPILEQVRPAIEKVLNASTWSVQGGGDSGDPVKMVEGAIAVGFGASATFDGIAVGRRVCAQPGMVCVDLAWLREVVNDARTK